jgi:hypothetical protein
MTYSAHRRDFQGCGSFADFETLEVLRIDYNLLLELRWAQGGVTHMAIPVHQLLNFTPQGLLELEVKGIPKFPFNHYYAEQDDIARRAMIQTVASAAQELPLRQIKLLFDRRDLHIERPLENDEYMNFLGGTGLMD